MTIEIDRYADVAETKISAIKEKAFSPEGREKVKDLENLNFLVSVLYDRFVDAKIRYEIAEYEYRIFIGMPVSAEDVKRYADNQNFLKEGKNV